MRIGRKILYSLCFLMILFAGSRMKPVLAAEYTYTDENGVTYEYTDAGVLKSVTGVVGSVDLAKMAEEKHITITCIDMLAFGDDNHVTSVNLPASVQIIDNYAFYLCTSLSEVTYEEGSKLASIGESAFAEDGALRDFHQLGTNKDGTLHLPESVNVIGGSAFAGTGFAKVIIPDGLNRIETGVFDFCESLTEVELSGNVTTIGNGAFRYTKLSSVKVPDKVTMIGENAFEGISTLREVIFPKKTRFTIEDRAFAYAGFTEVTLPGNCTKVGADAFADDYNSELSVVKIENDSMIIGKNAFPDTVALYGKEGSTAQKYAKENSLLFCTIEEDSSGQVNDEGGEQTPSPDDEKTTEDNTQTDKTPDDTDTASDDTNDTQVETPSDNVNDTQSETSSDNTSDTKEEIPSDSTNDTQSGTASDDTNNTQSGTSLDNTNDKQPGITPDNTDKTQPDVLPTDSLQPDMQQSDTSVQSAQPPVPVKLKVGTKYTIQGLIYKAVSESAVVFVKPEKKTITKLVVPDYITVEGCQFPVTGVAAKACYKFKKLKTVEIGNNISVIGAQAFQECKKLKEVTLGKELTQIGSKCFYKDSKLKRLVIKSTKLKNLGKKSMKGVPKKYKLIPKGCESKYKKLFKKAR